MPDYGPGMPMFGAQSTMRERGRSAQRLDPVIGGAEGVAGPVAGAAQGAPGTGDMTEQQIGMLIEALKQQMLQDTNNPQRMPLGGNPTENERRQMMLEQTSNPTEMQRQQMLQYQRMPLR